VRDRASRGMIRCAKMLPADAESERRWCVLAHASALLGLILPLGQILGPYLTSLLIPERSEGARQQAAEALDFQLAMVVLLGVLVALLLWLRAGWWFLVLFLPNLYAFGMAIRGATRASRGQPFRYPLALRLLRSTDTGPGPPEGRA
jgi:uncharacterized protein